jgi:glycosyltransferase involved in cell wall biosynthesis
MMAQDRLRGQNAVSILTCTKRPECMHALLNNYGRQKYTNKELIVIVNHHHLELNEYIKAAAPYENVRIYGLPDHVSLGSCLNYGVQLSKHSFIAKFDDDDYYAPDYLTESMRIIAKTNADIVGKRAHYMILKGKKLLLLRYPNKAQQYVPLVQGATLLVKRRVFNRVAFPDQSRGECVRFCADCAALGFKIYSGSPFNFIAVRRRNSFNHTWMVSDKDLLRKNAKVLFKVSDIKGFVRRS